MNKGTVTYRTAGSAALKPEYLYEEPTPIIEFETLRQANCRQRVYRAPRELTVGQKISGKVKSDPLLGSIDKAFCKPQQASWTNKIACFRYIAGVSMAFLALIFIGA